jgi:DnaD/phage-associated family protein
MSLEKSFYQFIDEYLGKTNLTYSVIYLYALRFATSGNKIPKMSEMANDMHLIPSDVHSAWLFWVSKGLASIDGEEITLSLVDTEIIRSKTIDKKFASLARSITREIGELSSSDMETLKYIHESIALPGQVLTVLIRFCNRDKGKKSMKYIEKLAIDWKEKNIDSIDKAESYIANIREGAKLKKERTSKKEMSKNNKIANFKPRPKTETDDLEDFWMDQLEKQAGVN